MVSNQFRLQSSLVIADHNDDKLSPITLNALQAAKQLNDDVSCLVAGANIKNVVSELTKYSVIKKLLVAENESFKGLLPERLTPLIVATHNQFKFTHIVAGANAFGKVTNLIILM